MGIHFPLRNIDIIVGCPFFAGVHTLLAYYSACQTRTHSSGTPDQEDSSRAQVSHHSREGGADEQINCDGVCLQLPENKIIELNS